MPNPLLHSAPLKIEGELLPDDTPLILVEIKGGTFKMGDDNAEYDDEKPAHPVQVKDFYIGQYPITTQQYAAFLNDYNSDQVQQGIFKGQKMIYEHRWGCQKTGGLWKPAAGFDQHPITSVTWHGAHEFCNWLSAKTQKNFRLPSEAQWEYAARGGEESHEFPYAGSYKLKEVGWYHLNSHSELKAVGWKKPNELGLHDMSGNVWEWCLDHWHNGYEGAPKDDRPWLDAKQAADPNASRVVRGGSWYLNAYLCRVSTRVRLNADVRNDVIGFRVLRY